MKQLRAWILRFRGLFGGDHERKDFAAEIESHLQMHIDDNLRSGMTAEEARRDAMIKLGGVEAVREAHSAQNTVPFLESFFQDIRFALRQLLRNPGFTFTAVLMLTLGIAASTAIFSFVDATLIKPLPYNDPNRLVHVTESIAVFPRANLSYFDYLDWKKQNQVFGALEVFNDRGFMMSTASGPELVRGTRVSAGFLKTLGVAPVIGRDFYQGEDHPGAPGALLLSYESWQTRFGGRKDVLGQSITLNDAPMQVIGVLPRGFHFAPTGNTEFWVPLQPNNQCEQRRSCHDLEGIARLKDGVSVETARANMKSIAAQLEGQYPDSNAGQGASVEPLYEVIVGDVRPILLTLLAGAGLLQLIACVNVVSLLLVRFESRRREIAVRGALGASAARLVRQFITESLVLVSMGAVFGIVTAALTMNVLLRLVSKDMMFQMPYLLGIGMNTHVVTFAIGVALVAAALFSVAPIVRLSSNDLREDLNESSRGASGMLWRRFGSNLVVVELAVAMVLLVGAGLLAKSFYRLLHVDLGFEPNHLASLSVSAPDAGYSKSEQQVALAREVENRLRQLPGVTSVGLTSTLPVNGNGNTNWIRMVGKPFNGEHNEVNHRDVSASYFPTLKTTLLRGRYFREDEDASKPNVVIINQAFAKKYFLGEDPVGQKIGDTELSPQSLREIVGVIDDLRESTLDSETIPSEYVPFNQSPDTYFNVVIRASQREDLLLPSVVTAIRGISGSLGTLGETTMSTRIATSQTAYLHRSSAWLVGGFAGMALLLGLVGLYGVIAYSVSRRTREIGVRIALGAQKRSVYQMILNEAGRLTVVGILAGVICSLIATTLMKKLLFGVRSWDIATLALVAVVLGLSGVAASFLPARRAASVNPIEALRVE